MTTPEQQALDLLKRVGLEGVQAVFAGYSAELASLRAERDALKAEIAALRGSAEPVAWQTFDGEGGYDYRSFKGNEDYRDAFVRRNGLKYAQWVDPLYTRPCVPLTEERIDSSTAEARNKLYDHCFEYGVLAEGKQKFIRSMARAIEAAHGIGEKK